MQYLECIIIAYLSRVNSSNKLKSHAMYSNAASDILGHQDKSSTLSCLKFSANNSTPSSVILEQPDSERTVRLGSTWTRLSSPWLVSSQQDRSRKAWRVPPCWGPKKESAASVTWYACRLSSRRLGSSWAVVENGGQLMQNLPALRSTFADKQVFTKIFSWFSYTEHGIRQIVTTHVCLTSCFLSIVI